LLLRRQGAYGPALLRASFARRLSASQRSPPADGETAALTGSPWKRKTSPLSRGCFFVGGATPLIARSVSDEAILTVSADTFWIASPSLSSGARSRDPLARNDEAMADGRSQGS